MPKTKQQKHDQVKVLTDKLEGAKSVVFADYRGMTMSQLSDIRKQLSETSSEFSVTKNTLMKIALKNKGIHVGDDILEGPTATLFAFGDEISPIKVIAKAIKDVQIGTIKGGILNGEAIGADKVKILATLPTKDELRGKVVGVLAAPLQGMVSVLQGNLRNLVYALDQIRIRQLAEKGGE